MQLVKPSIEHVDVTSDPIEAIETAGRTCWKSEDKIGEGTAEKFVKMVMDKKHDAVLEHGNFILSVSLHLFKSIQDILERQFIRMTNDVRSGNGCLISGNPRAFRDFCRHSDVDPEIQRALAYELTKKAPLLFEYMLHDHLDIEEPYYGDFDVKLFENINNLSSTERLAHQVLSYRIVCDRGVTHEIVRHRLFSYAQESTRYCNYKRGVTFIIPPWLYDALEDIETVEATCNFEYYLEEFGHLQGESLHWLHAMACAEIKYCIAINNLEWTPQQARSVLSNSLKTEIVVTGNLQEWMHFFKLRCSPKAHPQMQEVANMILADARTRVPDCFYGIE